MENLSLREFIEKREAEIKEIRSNLLKELKELKSAKAAIEGVCPSATNETKQKSVPTIKEMVLSILENKPRGASPQQIIELISKRYRVEIVRSSLSPQLSRLKADGKLNLDERNGVWMLPNTVAAQSKSAFSIGDLKSDGQNSADNIRPRMPGTSPAEVDDEEDLV